ncbi:5,10-methenyltetrahydromethanopterin hydrogenase cofactor biosynthesis protein HmdC [Methanobacterium alcaliphilum]|uniref:5,10-methenyltetrahydromethanopterin hydrogenase cofactor biosynthesis protein HmdC n=1 Tax=Methanobacterium alcaliphilum TaxID=392018 RepID=UPI00200A0A1B|nr:5,10-methenyltetrahydromethanopterin hydrogenase cofactor biosynthesis protein HmdC [Methanobacterium alcaliphilum]MCK9152538.1 5,10-methenyltetrahydromethanopterin hydrogenase cofactor biosynthesis protein HmdC [Methanobacterium alcaliphilum]
MHDIVKEAINDLDAAWELSKLKKDPLEIIDAVSELERNDVYKLGMNFKTFPLGCDLTEILAGTCASDLDKIDLIGNCVLSDSIGASIHVCAYAFADIAESNGMRPIDLIREVREATDVPMDLDHFGKFGPMRFPKEIIRCHGQCYMQGPPFDGCPRDRIHSRLLDKEKDSLADREEWVKLASSVAINLTCVQGGESHAAPLDEAKEVADLAKKHGKGIESIMFVGDGYDDLISGFNTALDMNADVFVLEGGPFNQAEDRLDAFARAVAIARILVPGKIVATNGAYEDECRVGLRAGLNAIITGFPQNHHGYMCGYSPGTAKRGNFGLPRVMQIIREEINCGCGCGSQTRAPIGKDELEALAASVKVVGPENVYPQKIGDTYLGDAHWVCIAQSPLYSKAQITNTVSDIAQMTKDGEIKETVALFGGRFVSWAMAKELDGMVDQIIISDLDPWVEKVTVNNLRSELKTDIIRGNSDDKGSYDLADTSIITSTIPNLARKLSKNLPGAISLVD